MNHREENRCAELESLREAFLRVGLDLKEEELAKLAPQLRVLHKNIDRISNLELSDIEPQMIFDPRWRR